MSEDNALVLVAGYQDLDSARHDFQTLVDAAKDKSIPLQGAVLIGKDAEGSPVLVDTGNRLGRRGAAWGAGVGSAPSPAACSRTPTANRPGSSAPASRLKIRIFRVAV